MTSVSVVPASAIPDHGGSTIGVERLPDEMNDMKLRDDKVPAFCLLSVPLATKLTVILFIQVLLQFS